MASELPPAALPLPYYCHLLSGLSIALELPLAQRPYHCLTIATCSAALPLPYYCHLLSGLTIAPLLPSSQRPYHCLSIATCSAALPLPHYCHLLSGLTIALLLPLAQRPHRCYCHLLSGLTIALELPFAQRPYHGLTIATCSAALPLPYYCHLLSGLTIAPRLFRPGSGMQYAGRTSFWKSIWTPTVTEECSFALVFRSVGPSSCLLFWICVLSTHRPDPGHFRLPPPVRGHVG